MDLPLRRVSPRMAIALIAAASLVAGGLAASDGARAEDAPRTPGQVVRTWSYVGPGAPLVGATIALRDRAGTVLATGVTTATGTYTFDLSGRAPVATPLTVTTSRGTAAGSRFDGHLKARVFAASSNYAVVQNSLISTAASQMATTRRGYAIATGKVRRALGIPRGSLAEALRLPQGAVSYSRLRREARRAGGFDVLATRLADAARDGRRITGLRPKSPSASVAGTPRARGTKGANQMAAETTMCGAPLPTSGSTSSQNINDIAQLGVAGLLKYAGMPTTGSAGVTGMLLSALGAAPSPSNISLVQQDVMCLSQQINYLSAQIAALQLSVDIQPATNCSNAIGSTNAWSGYQYLINNSAQYPINKSNTSLTTSYLPAWNNVANTCGSAINNMLFGTLGGQQSAWQQLNLNTRGSLKWYTQAQVQDLQTFLSYWGTLLYQQFVLTNEYQNYYGNFEAAASAAGAAINAAGQTVCAAGSNAQTSSYCVWGNNIIQAFPGNLYSDELGIIASGTSINALPGGMVAGAPIMNPVPAKSAAATSGYRDTQSNANQQGTPTAMNVAWWYNSYLNYTPIYLPAGQQGGGLQLQFAMTGGIPKCLYIPGGNTCPKISMSSPNYIQASVDRFNSLGAPNPNWGTAVQTFSNSQASGRFPVTASDISALKSAGPGGLSATTALYNAVNQSPGGGTAPWSSLSASNVTYMTNDGSSWFNAYTEGVYNSQTGKDTYYAMMCWSGALGKVSTQCPYKGTAPTGTYVYQGPSNLPPTPVIAMLTGRTWWPGAATATSYQPPPPPVP